jgi:hypothetical protein
MRAAAVRPLPAIEEEATRGRIEAALHSDPYLYDAHVTVSMYEGDAQALRRPQWLPQLNAGEI